VAATSSFCPNVEWLKNRQITLGCTSSTLYCPSNSVTRIQMAAFLHRVGTALTPMELAPVSEAAAPRDISTPLVLCQTADFSIPTTNTPPGPYPRRAYVNGAAHLSVPTAGVDVQASLQFSTNGGASWSQIAGATTYASLYPGGPPGNYVSVSPYGWADFEPGQTVRFAIVIAQFAGTGNVTAGCNLFAQIANRNSPSSPF
jgi:hypothetical protein